MQNKELKFRAKYNGEWIYFTINDLIEIGCTPYHNMSDNDHNILYHDSKTRGQYIGTTDKNGKEIYTGDIVRAWHEEHEEFVEGIIEFNDMTYKLKCLEQSDTAKKYGYIDYIRYWDDGNHDWYTMEHYSNTDLEVISNIF